MTLTSFLDPLPIGAAAPDFTVPARLAGQAFTFHLADALKKGPVVLYFYPVAFTSGCTVEAHDFAAAAGQFEALGATIVGMSGDGIERLNRFSISECRGRFAVASADSKLLSAYRVKLPLLPISNRTSYVIAPNGKIAFVYKAMSPAGHVEKTLTAVKTCVRSG